MKCVVLTLFPDHMRRFFLKGIQKRAYDAALFDICFIDLRDFSTHTHRQVDDHPYGGRRGLVLQADVVSRAIKSIDKYDQYRLLYPSPGGCALTKDCLFDWASADKDILILCGYYEGVDERVFEWFPFQKVSLGSFVLTSGELPALAMLDALVRLLPHVLGNPECVYEESIYSGMLEHAQYTSPREVLGLSVPDVLLGGNHSDIDRWKRQSSLANTLWNRYDLLDGSVLNREDRQFLTGILQGGRM